MSIGKGMTYRLEQKVIGETKFCDTPGLADVQQKKEAGVAIRDSLNIGGPHKILFFCRIDEGRVNLADKTTMKLVHEAAREIGSQYGVIINKVSKGTMKKLNAHPEMKKGFQDSLFEGMPKTTHVWFLPYLEDLDAEDDALVSLDKLTGLGSFLEQVPVINLTPQHVKYIRVEEFDVVMQELEEIKSKNEKLEKDVEILKAEREAEKKKKGV